MKLFKYEDYEVKVSEEALMLEPFMKIYKRDRGKYKTVAMQEMAYIYFMYDPRSDYMFIVDEKRRSREIKEHIGMRPGWKEDKLIEEAVELYKYLTTTTASLLLKTTRLQVDKLLEQMEKIDYDERTDKGALVFPLNTVATVIDKIPSLVKKIIDAEKMMHQLVEELSRMRGAGTKKILEDGI